MAKITMNYTDFFPYVMRKMQDTGLLLASWQKDGRANAMTIGWGMVGSVWSRPIWQVLVRPSRYTFELLNQDRRFSVNVLPQSLKNALVICGTKSGRELDKIKATNLTVVEGKGVGAPLIEESIISYECLIIHENDFLPEKMLPDIKEGIYPSGDFHRVYWGQIINAIYDPERLEEDIKYTNRSKI